MLAKSFLGAVLCCLACVAVGQEVFLLGGALRNTNTGERAYTWSMDYNQILGEHTSASLSWINDGHFQGNHRDGEAAQLWARTRAFDDRLVFAAAIGPYIYFDTIPGPSPDSSRDKHGLGILSSVAATWNIDGTRLVQLRINRIDTRHSTDTTSVLLGIGYQLDAARATSASTLADMPNEVALYSGTTIENTFQSEGALAAEVEYRRRLGPYLAWTLGWLNEGTSTSFRRGGPAVQLWAGRDAIAERVRVDIGVGPYIVADLHNNASAAAASRERLAGILSLSAAYYVAPQWPLRFTWHRVFAEHAPDTDVLVLGVGYRF